MRTTMKTFIQLWFACQALSLAGCGLLLENDEDDSDPSWTEFDAMGLPELRLTADSYADCSELQADMQHNLKERQAIHRRAREYKEARRNFNDRKGISTHSDHKTTNDGAIDVSGAPGNMANGDGDDFDSAETSDSDGSFTNVQVAGVDEADTTKIGDNHIFVQVGNKITVADRTTFQELGTMTAPADQLAMYAKGKYLVLLSNENTTKTVCTESKTNDGIFTQVCDKRPVRGTHVEIFSAEKGKMPEPKSTHQVDGNYFDSRLIDDRVVLAINTTMAMKPGIHTTNHIEDWGDDDAGNDWEEEEWQDEDDWNEWETANDSGGDSDDDGGDAIGDDDANASADGGVGSADPTSLAVTFNLRSMVDAPEVEEVPAEPVTLDEDGTVAGVPCNKIARPALPDLDFRITKVAAIDLNTDQVDLTAVLGGGDQIYMSTTSIFVAKSGSHWSGWISPTAPAEEKEDYYTKLTERRDSSIITEISVKDKLTVKAHGSVLGLIVDQWSWNHYASGQVAIFTHTRQASDTNRLENHLYVLKQDGPTLKPVAAIKNFGHDEDLKAARYVGDKAYAITFRETDPLFVFDMQDPEKPALLGELEIPGFSAYLHPIAPDRLIGVGFGNGVEVNLFDVSDPMSPQRIDVMPVGANNAEVTANHRAFFIDEKRKRFGFGFSSGRRDLRKDFLGNKYYGDSGAFILEVVDDKIVKKATLSHRESLSACYGKGDISRMYNLDDNFVTISAMGIVAYNPDDLTASVKQAGFDECQEKPVEQPKITEED